MKKYLSKGIKIIFILNIIFWSFILSSKNIKAEDEQGCCIIDSPVKGMYAINTSASDCEHYNTTGGPRIAEFVKNSKAKGKTCVAQDDLGAAVPKFGNPLDNPKIAVSIPGLSKFGNIKCEKTTNSAGEEEEACYIPWLVDYMQALYKYGIATILILAVITMMIAGLIWLTAAGNESKVGEAKKWISGSLFGVLIALSSYMILNILNPALTQLSPIKLASIGKTDLQELTIVDPEDLTPANTTELSEGSHGTGQGQYKLPIYYQGSYSQPSCMGSSACGPTSLSMILNYHGINKTPPEVAIDSEKRGHWSCSGWNGGMESFKDMLDYYKTNLKTKSGSSFDDIKELLKYGPVIASIRNSGSAKRGDPSRCPFTGRGHYVVFTGYSNGTFYTNDPNAGNRGKTDAILESSFIGKCYINAGVMAIYK